MSDWNALLIHGAGGGAWEWNRWRGVFEAQAIATLAIELQPGAQGLAETALQDYADQVVQDLRRLPRPRVVVGASLGGLLAAMCARKADALVLVNPFPPAPWHQRVSFSPPQPVIAWQGNARLHSTRQAMPDADDASALRAFRHWRDESGLALSQAQAGIEVAKPDCPALFVVSRQDEDVPPQIILEWAQAWRAERLETLADSHVGPLLGNRSQEIALQTVGWLNRLAKTR